MRHGAAFGKAQPEARVDLEDGHRLDETVEGGLRLPAVKELHPQVIEQLVVTADPERLDGPAREGFS